jgi:hypothetical protein
MLFCVGLKPQGRVSWTLESKSTLMMRPPGTGLTEIAFAAPAR